jgi:protoheme IX farnesyltransferase
VVAPAREVTKQIVWYSYATVACSLLLWPIGHTGLVYPIAAAVLGVVFLVEAHRLDLRARAGKDGVALQPMRLFHFSNMYLALLFVAAAVSPLIH